MNYHSGGVKFLPSLTNVLCTRVMLHRTAIWESGHVILRHCELLSVSLILFLNVGKFLHRERAGGLGEGWGQETAAEGNLIVIIICDAKTHLSIYIIHQFSITCNYLSFRKREEKNEEKTLTPPRAPSPLA